jgi:phosphoribosylamine--glycine ligase
MDSVTIFHAGTGHGLIGEIVAQGGRVLNVSALGRDVDEARSRAYAAIGKIDWPGGFCRFDIGLRPARRQTS